jgi:hypothetical protein
MKLSKELNDALEAVSKEVDSWPAWKRSIDLHDLKQQTESTEYSKASRRGLGSQLLAHQPEDDQPPRCDSSAHGLDPLKAKLERNRIHPLPPEFKKVDFFWYTERVNQMANAGLYTKEGWLPTSHNSFRFLSQWNSIKLPFRLIRWKKIV